MVVRKKVNSGYVVENVLMRCGGAYVGNEGDNRYNKYKESTLCNELISDKIEKLMRGFLWSKGDLKKGEAKVKWNDVCCVKTKGGLGIKHLHMWNRLRRIVGAGRRFYKVESYSEIILFIGGDCWVSSEPLSLLVDLNIKYPKYSLAEDSSALALQVLRRSSSIFTSVYVAVLKLKKTLARASIQLGWQCQAERCRSPLRS
ncbi:hypothetical protein Tco_0663445 [Tanacetum coccineum]